MQCVDLRIPAKAVREDMRQIGFIGRLGKRPTDGYLRASYSPEETEAIEYIMSRGKSLCADINRRDQVGNGSIIWEGRDPSRKIVLHSHLDTVVRGGNFDGVVGVVSALVGIERILSAYPEKSQRPFSIELRVSCGEESGTYKQAYKGSLAAFGRLKPQHLENTFLDPRSGKIQTLEQAMKSQGIDPEFVRSGQRAITQSEADSILYAIESHIEQGRILQNSGVDIGCVTDIFGAFRVKVEFLGAEDHSGTTPNKDRRDANLASALWMREMDEFRKAYVARTGHEIRQNFGVIEGGVGYSSVSAQSSVDWEVRAGSREVLDDYFKQAKTIHRQIWRETRVKISTREEGRTNPIQGLSERVQDTILAAATKAGLSKEKIELGAGHDTVVYAEELEGRAGMFVIPCRNGVSHSRLEFSPRWQIANAATVHAFGIQHLMALYW